MNDEQLIAAARAAALKAYAPYSNFSVGCAILSTAGEVVNLEFDIVGKYVAKLLASQGLIASAEA